jgi:hypothetical protein
MSSDPQNRPEYNDNDVPIDEGVKQRLLDHGSADFSPPLPPLNLRDCFELMLSCFICILDGRY